MARKYSRIAYLLLAGLAIAAVIAFNSYLKSPEGILVGGSGAESEIVFEGRPEDAVFTDERGLAWALTTEENEGGTGLVVTAFSAENPETIAEAGLIVFQSADTILAPRWGLSAVQDETCGGKSVYFVTQDRDGVAALKFMCVPAAVFSEETTDTLRLGEAITLVASGLSSFDLAPPALSRDESGSVLAAYTTEDGQIDFLDEQDFSPDSSRSEDGAATASEGVCSQYDDVHFISPHLLSFSCWDDKLESWQITVIDLAKQIEYKLTETGSYNFSHPIYVPGNLPLLVFRAKAATEDNAAQSHIAALTLVFDREGGLEGWGNSVAILTPEDGLERLHPSFLESSETVPLLEMAYEIVDAGGPGQIKYASKKIEIFETGTSPAASVTKSPLDEESLAACGSSYKFPGFTESALIAYKTDEDDKTVKVEFIPKTDFNSKDCECDSNETCDDGNSCSKDSCEQNKCVYSKSDDPACCQENYDCPSNQKCESYTCIDNITNCSSDADCAAADQNLCDGPMYCDKSGGAEESWVCKINTKQAVVCSIGKDTSCAKNTCQPQSGDCVMQPINEGGSCSDNDSCTTGDVCHAGSCQPGPDTCGCKSDADCPDSNLCDGTPYCDLAAHSCKNNPSTIVTCPSVDNTACQTNTCQPATGKCTMVAETNGKSCDDGNAYTQSDSCQQGMCQGTELAVACKQSSDCPDDGNLCNGVYYCKLDSDPKKNACILNEATIITCPSVDDTTCQKNTCQPKTGTCNMMAEPDGKSCNDSNAYTGNDSCLQGECKGKEISVACKINADCQDDGDLCNGTPYCALDANDVTKNQCVTNPATVVSCPAGKSCVNGSCVSQ